MAIVMIGEGFGAGLAFAKQRHLVVDMMSFNTAGLPWQLKNVCGLVRFVTPLLNWKMCQKRAQCWIMKLTIGYWTCAKTKTFLKSKLSFILLILFFILSYRLRNTICEPIFRRLLP